MKSKLRLVEGHIMPTISNTLYYWLEEERPRGVTIGMCYDHQNPVPMFFSDSAVIDMGSDPSFSRTSATERIAGELRLAIDEGRIFHRNAYPPILAQNDINEGILPRPPIPPCMQQEIFAYLGRNVPKLRAA